mmetsp:Transcript_47709/g.80060  ORF Transcript_47709/g.80060 Transcript_47709/m.80060 type:complete len:210 (-) Transcript_47709:2745-3374(-)
MNADVIWHLRIDLWHRVEEAVYAVGSGHCTCLITGHRICLTGPHRTHQQRHAALDNTSKVDNPIFNQLASIPVRQSEGAKYNELRETEEKPFHKGLGERCLGRALQTPIVTVHGVLLQIEGVHDSIARNTFVGHLTSLVITLPRLLLQTKHELGVKDASANQSGHNGTRHQGKLPAHDETDDHPRDQIDKSLHVGTNGTAKHVLDFSCV